MLQEAGKWDAAECANIPLARVDALFFPVRRDDRNIIPAKQLCAKCPLLNECRELALTPDNGIQFGILAGMLPDERAALTQRRETFFITLNGRKVCKTCRTPINTMPKNCSDSRHIQRATTTQENNRKREGNGYNR